MNRKREVKIFGEKYNFRDFVAAAVIMYERTYEEAYTGATFEGRAKMAYCTLSVLNDDFDVSFESFIAKMDDEPKGWALFIENSEVDAVK